MNLWGGRFKDPTHRLVKDFTTSLGLDTRLWQVDLRASMAHVRMLGQTEIIALAEAQALLSGLEQIQAELAAGKNTLDPEAEDIHSAIEARLLAIVGEPAKKLHTARSRNDQVATDLRLFLAEGTKQLRSNIRELQQELLRQAEPHAETLLAGTTHLQHAQPVSLAHHLMAYFWMLERDHERLSESEKRVLTSPLGSAALAGTSFPIDRKATAAELGFAKTCENSLDAVSDRDFVIEFLAGASILSMHLSRLAEEWILWSTPEFGYISLNDAVTTGSSIMPQKKNPDVAELIRGRSGRTYGALMGALTLMKGLPLSYNRDLQEDKVHLFSGLDTALSCVSLCTLMLQNTQFHPQRMREALVADFSNATDLADDLVKKGATFREAHTTVGKIVQHCLGAQKALEELSTEELRQFDSRFSDSSASALQHEQVLCARTSEGGASPTRVREQIAMAKKTLLE